MNDFTSQDSTLEPASEKTYAIDPFELENFQRKLKNEQSMIKGFVAGAIAALIGTIIWTTITVVTEFQIGWMAVGVAFLVGYAIRKFGKGVDKKFGVMGAILSFFSCISGNVATAAVILAQIESISVFEILFIFMLNPTAVFEVLSLTFSPIDLLFYGLAIYEGYKLSFRQVTRAEIEGMLREKPAL